MEGGREGGQTDGRIGEGGKGRGRDGEWERESLSNKHCTVAYTV